MPCLVVVWLGLRVFGSLPAHPPICLVKAAMVGGASMRFGVVATRDLTEEEVYLSVPLSIVMDAGSAMRCMQCHWALVKVAWCWQC